MANGKRGGKRASVMAVLVPSMPRGAAGFTENARVVAAKVV
jgi:hypothetical protein